MDQLTPNFWRHEFEVGSKGGRIPEAYLYRIQALCTAVLQPIRDKWGRIAVTSGYRPGATTGSGVSQHAMCEAADFNMVADRNDVWAWLVKAAALGFPVDQAIIYPDTRHLHVSHTTRGKNRRQLLVKVGTQYVPWLDYRGPLKVST